ncbi:MAG: signal peptidase II [Ruminiclostridium sp.]
MTYIALLAALALVGIDQLTKWLAVTILKPAGSVNLISIGGKEWLNLTYVENTGAAFSILEGKQIFLIIITTVVIVGMIFMLLTKRVKSKPVIWSIALIIAGGIGNLIDRIFNGYVVDFVDVRIIRFAVFNFADICAVVGAALLILFIVIDEIKAAASKKKAGKTEEAQTESTDEQV